MIFIVIILGLLAGILVHIYNDNQVSKAQVAQAIKLNEIASKRTNIVATVSPKEKSSPDAKIIFETYYNKCGHSNTETKTVDSSEVNKEEDYFTDKYKEWTLKSFSTKEIKFYKEVNEMCDKHYVIHDNEGIIAIYTLDADGNETLKKNTEISTKYLPEEDLQLLKNGIKAFGDKELEEKLSDFE